MDALKNFAYSLVATPPSPATSGTSLVVTAGQGALFPTAPFDATIWPAGVQPLSTNAEIVRVTAVSTDTFTITRAQYGTTAQSITAGYQIAQTIDANLLSQLAPLSGATFTGEVVAPDFKVTGITGATAGTTRLVGVTASSYPTSGTFVAGDVVADQTGTFWVCITGGTPGTWTNVIPNSLVVRSATATAGIGEFTIYGTSGTSGQTITLPASPQNGAIYQIKNLSAYTVNIKGGTNSISVSGTIYGASATYTIPLNAAYSFVFTGGVWYCFVTTDLAQMSSTLPVANGGTGVTTATGSGSVVLSTSPSLTTPNFSSIVTGGGTLTLPSTTDTLVATATTDTLSNKTMTAPVLNSAVVKGPIEPVSISGTALSGSTAASVAIASASVYYYTANPTASWALNITNAPTTTGQSATVALLVNNGSTAYLPSNITINTVQAGASSSALPTQGATNNSITSYYQSGTAWSAADASTLDVYTLTVICTGSSAWTLLLGLTKF